MTMQTFSIDIATASTRLSKKWRNRSWLWTELVAKCRETRRTSETLAEYKALPKDEQSAIKDVGGFVGGYLSGGQRKKGSVKHRSCATLDIDYGGDADTWEEFTMQYGCAALLYSTHKHTPEAPRLRLVVPFARPVAPEEYEPICRRIAEAVGIETFDHTTYETARLFYWPSTSKDGEFVFEVQDGEPLDPDKVLATYTDWHDASEWPRAAREGALLRRDIKKAGDPLTKNGVIGAFCRAHSIEEAIEVYLPHVYEKTRTEGRYTYKDGSVAGGLVTYDGKWAYSHHDTDPAGGKLCNAFDLVRLHIYGELDKDVSCDNPTALPSYHAMTECALQDPAVSELIAREREERACQDFAGLNDDDTEGPDEQIEKADTDGDWRSRLETDKHGKIKSTTGNVLTILQHDNRLRGRIVRNLFSGFVDTPRGLPWNKRTRTWGNSDDASLRVYLEAFYGITGAQKIDDAKEMYLQQHSVHPIRNYLREQKWDGQQRLDSVIIDYIGAPDTPLVRAMTRKFFTAAVARVMRPGCKFDYCLVLQGKEGIGKSSLFATLAGDWFNDSLTTMEGKQSMEQLRGGWIFELSELSSIKKSDNERTKSFFSSQTDTYRPAYGRVVERHPRQCVFCGTTNEEQFLKGHTGNRRFWIIPCDATKRKRQATREALEANRGQLWAEALHYYEQGETLYLSQDLEREARKNNEAYNFNSDDIIRDSIIDYLERLLPDEWDTLGELDRRAYYSAQVDERGTRKLEKATAQEFCREYCRLDPITKPEQYRTALRNFNRIMPTIAGWSGGEGFKRTLYGRHRCFQRIDNEDEGYL